jgi:hypothetical protein
MFAHPKLVRRRRVKRRLKAAASIAIAVAAGTFLACQRQVAKLAGDAGSGGEAGAAATATASSPATQPAEAAATSAPLDASSAPPGDAANVVADARTDGLARDAATPKDAAVDVNQHRKGMPVPDNLLE